MIVSANKMVQVKSGEFNRIRFKLGKKEKEIANYNKNNTRRGTEAKTGVIYFLNRKIIFL